MNHSIGIVARRTGLTPHVIRVWERRYRAVTPDRTGTNRRLYSEAELERLSLLRLATQAGHKIGDIARLSVVALRRMAAEDTGAPVARGGNGAGSGGEPERQLLEEALEAVRRFDGAGLRRVLDRAVVALGQQGLLKRLVVTLTRRIGDEWAAGLMTAGHEHFASSVIHVFLGQHCGSYAVADSAPVLVVGTPAGQFHALGAAVAAAAAAAADWRVTFLGASLPASEIANAARNSGARAVALSIVFPSDDPHLARELVTLRSQLPPQVAILAGGQAAPGYQDTLHEIGATLCRDLDEFTDCLRALRDRPRPRSAARSVLLPNGLATPNGFEAYGSGPMR